MRRKCLLGAVIPLMTILASTGVGAIVPLGDSGWSAVWSDSAYTNLQVVYESEDATTVHLRIIDEYTSDSVNLSAGLQSDAHSIVFIPTGANPVQTLTIVLQEQTNDTGLPWEGWRMALLGPGAAFDDQSAATWNDGNFPNATHQPQDLRFLAGLQVEDGQTWTAGGRQAVVRIQITPDENGKISSFSLKQYPMLAVVPEPSMGLVLSAAGMLLLRRVRRA